METTSFASRVRNPEVWPSSSGVYTGGKDCVVRTPLTTVKMPKSHLFFVLQDLYWLYSTRVIMIYKAIKIETIEHTTADLSAEQVSPFSHFSKRNGNLIQCCYIPAGYK